MSHALFSSKAGSTRRGLSLLLCLLLPILTQAQVRVHYSADADGESVFISARDSASRDVLPGASLMITAQGDTLRLSSDGIYGNAFFKLRDFRHDTVTIHTSYMGYKSRIDKVALKNRMTSSIDIYLQSDPEQLNQLVVVGDAVAMVMHGDTTLFNAAAFSSMEGDLLRDLLKKMPGVEVSENGVTYLGKKIDRILFNGQNLFGKDMSSAMDMVLSREVQSVKVYDKTAVDDVYADGSEAKERVMDVKTWDPLSRVGMFQASAYAGEYLSSKDNDQHQCGGQLIVGNFVMSSRPNIRGDISYSRNPLNAMSPYTIGAFSLGLGKDIQGKEGYRIDLSANTDKLNQSESNSTVFEPSDLWKARSDTSFSSSGRRNRSMSLNGNGFKRKGLNAFYYNGGVSLFGGRSEGRNFTSTSQDGVESLFDRLTRDSSETFKYNLSLRYIRSFSKKRRRLSIEQAVTGSLTNGNGSRKDNGIESILNENLSNELASRSVSPTLNIHWNEPIGKKSIAIATFGGLYSYSTLNDRWTDILTGSVNATNSKDYANKQISGSASLAYRYGQINDGLYFQLSAQAQNIHIIRDEHLVNVANWSGNYFLIRPAIDLSYTKGERQLSFDYAERGNVPDTYQLRTAVNDANPLFLTAGNPSLEMPVSRNLHLSYGRSVFDKNLTLTLQGAALFTSDAITSKTIYYGDRTYLPAYDYYAPKGSSLTIPVNVSGERSASMSLELSRYFSGPKLGLTLGTGVAGSVHPFYLGDNLSENASRSMHLNASLLHTSAKYELSLYASCIVGRYLIDGSTQYDYLAPTITPIATVRIGKHLEINATARYEQMLTTGSGIDYTNVHADAKLTWIVGKDAAWRFSVYGQNLTDTFTGRENKVTQDYIRAINRDYLGRSVGVSLLYTFMRR